MRGVTYGVMLVMCLFICVLGIWQIMVLRGRSMKNPDGSVDDWHVQKLFYGIALADVFIAVPATLIGAGLAFAGHRPGWYLMGMSAFWFMWSNVMTTAVSLRFEKPRLTLPWFFTFPFGALLGAAYIALTLVWFEEFFKPATLP